MKNKAKIENTLGMFDLLKGVGMLLIVFAHNTSVFPELFEKSSTMERTTSLRFMSFFYEIPIIPRLLFAILITFGTALMPAFLSVGGYGFRKRTIGKGFKLLSKEMIKPYIFTVIGTTICNVCLHYAFFRYLPGALSESLKVFLGMALGVSQNVTIGGYTIFANGPVWYLLAYFWALAIFNVVLNLTSDKFIPHVVLVISAAGWLLSYLPFTPWCISQGMVGVVYVYMGYWVKKNKLIGRDYTLKDKLLVLFLIVIPNVVMCSFGFITEMADNVYSLGPVTYIENGLMGIVFVYLFLHLNVFRGKVSGTIRTIGRYSLYIMCIHTVDMIAIPWYKVSEFFATNQMLGFCVVYFVRLAIIFLAVFLVVNISKHSKLLVEKRKVIQR